jgi:hypothetical protein
MDRHRPDIFITSCQWTLLVIGKEEPARDRLDLGGEGEFRTLGPELPPEEEALRLNMPTANSDVLYVKSQNIQKY